MDTLTASEVYFAPELVHWSGVESVTCGRDSYEDGTPRNGGKILAVFQFKRGGATAYLLEKGLETRYITRAGVRY